MRHIILFSVLVMLLTVSNIFAQDMNDEAAKLYKELNTPGEEHAMLGEYEGKWKSEVTSFIPGMGESTSTANGEARLILGGRFLEIKSTGEYMGQMVESISILGFDKRFKKFTLDGYDTMGTYGTHSEGEYDKGKNIITYKGKNYEPLMKAYIDYTFKFYLTSKDEFSYELFFHMPDGSDMKLFEVKNTRM